MKDALFCIRDTNDVPLMKSPLQQGTVQSGTFMSESILVSQKSPEDLGYTGAP